MTMHIELLAYVILLVPTMIRVLLHIEFADTFSIV